MNDIAFYGFCICVLVGLGLFIQGIYSICTTNGAIWAAVRALVGIGLAGIVAPFIALEGGVRLTPAVQNVLLYHQIITTILLWVLGIVLVIDLVSTLFGHPLAYEYDTRHLPTPAAGTPAVIPPYMAHVRAKEIAMDIIGLSVVIIGGLTWNWYLTKPESHLEQVVAIARGRDDIKATLSPFIVEIDAHSFSDVETLKQEAVQSATQRGVQGLVIDKVLKVRFIARDNQHINEAVLVFDGWRTKKGAPGRPAIVGCPLKGTRDMAAVPPDNEPLDGKTISVFRTPSKATTEGVANEIIGKFSPNDPLQTGVLPMGTPTTSGSSDPFDFRLDAIGDK